MSFSVNELTTGKQKLVIYGYFRNKFNYPTISFIPNAIIQIIMDFYVTNVHLYVSKKDEFQLFAEKRWNITNLITNDGTYFLLSENELFVRSGRDNSVGALGLQHNQIQLKYYRNRVLQWTKNEFFINKNHPKLIAKGFSPFHTFILTKSNQLFSFGCNDKGQLGIGRKSTNKKK